MPDVPPTLLLLVTVTWTSASLPDRAMMPAPTSPVFVGAVGLTALPLTVELSRRTEPLPEASLNRPPPLAVATLSAMVLLSMTVVAPVRAATPPPLGAELSRTVVRRRVSELAPQLQTPPPNDAL